MGLDAYLQRGEETIEHNSAHFPDHLFKIGYFRSSYNDSGTNAVLRQQFGTTLQDLFGIADEYEVIPKVIPNWGTARANAIALVERMEARIDEGSPFLSATKEWNIGKSDCALQAIVHAANGDYYIVRELPAECLRWHLEAIKIVVETCDWVMAQPDPSQFSMRWSG